MTTETTKSAPEHGTEHTTRTPCQHPRSGGGAAGDEEGEARQHASRTTQLRGSEHSTLCVERSFAASPATPAPRVTNSQPHTRSVSSKRLEYAQRTASAPARALKVSGA